jgi:DNA-binding GntR family transcriptional regulator
MKYHEEVIMSATTQLGPVGTTSRTSHVLEMLKTAILNGELAPGEPLVESELAGRLGVSKTPVREALKSLEGTGLVVIRPYTGATVRVFSDADAVAIYDMRLLLEPEAVRRSIVTGIDIDEAGAALARAGIAESGSQRSLANREFHRALYRNCGNPLMVQSLDGLRDQIALISSGSWARSASWQREAEEHAQILDVARAGDAEGAKRLVREHIGDFAQRHIVPPGSDAREGGAA